MWQKCVLQDTQPPVTIGNIKEMSLRLNGPGVIDRVITTYQSYGLRIRHIMYQHTPASCSVCEIVIDAEVISDTRRNTE